MSGKRAFPFQTTKHAWDMFDKAAEICFQRLLIQESLVEQAKPLRNRAYCARLMYILNVFAHEGDHEREFGIDWAMLLARPMSAHQAQSSLDDLIKLGLITDIEEDNIRDVGGTGKTSNDKFEF